MDFTVFVIAFLPALVESQSVTVCEGAGPKTLQCGPGTTISITTVLHGRTNALPTSTCNPLGTQITNLNCRGTQAVSVITTNCDGKSTCKVENDYQVLGDPCPGVPKFLKVDYSCVGPTTPATTASTTTVVQSTKQLPAMQKTICVLKTENFVCPSGQEIMISKVFYGRIPPINQTFCNQYNTYISPTTNCIGGAVASNYVKSLCDGQQSCSVTNDWQKLGPDPCSGIPKYLQIDYRCVSKTTTSNTTPKTSSSTASSTTSSATTPTSTTTAPTTSITTPTTTATQPMTTATQKLTTRNTPSTLSTTTQSTAGGSTVVACPGLPQRLRCSPGDEIIIDYVLYGRTNSSPCNPANAPIANLNCVSTQKSTSTVETMCNHQSACLVKADSQWLGEDPCPGTPKYLQVKFHCDPLAPPTTSTTKRTTTPVTTAPTTVTTTSSTTTTTPTTSTTTTTPTTTPTTTTTTTTPTTTTTTPTTTTTTTTPTTTTTTPTTTTTTTTPTTTTTTPTTTTTTTTSTSTTTTPTTTTTTPTTTTTTSTTTTPTTTTTTPSSTSTTSTPTSTTTTLSTVSTPTTPTATPTTITPPTTFPPYVPFQAPANVPAGAQVCHEYLVSGPRGVPDSHLTASSQWNSHLPSDNNGPERARLYTPAHDYGNGSYDRGAWSAAYNDKNQYIQVELTRSSLVRGIVTQGRHVDPLTLCCVQRVTQYKVMWSRDGTNWNTIQDKQGNDKVFPGNIDDDSLVTHMLECPVIARFIRLLPQVWTNHIALRFDVIGCQAVTDDIGKCPSGWLERPGSDSCYLFTSGSNLLSWDEAKRSCQLNQGHLVDIQSIKERDFILQEIRNRPQISMWWVGLSNKPRQDNKDFKWTDGKDLDPKVLQWKKGQPDNGGYGEHCGEFWNEELNDDNCENKRHYICETDKYWTMPVNKPPLAIVTPPTKSTGVTQPATTSTTRSTPSPTYSRPTTVNIHLPTRAGATVVTNKQNVFTTGCIQTFADCQSKQQGDYPNCQGCGYYITCASSGIWVRPCPGSLKFDDNTKTCEYRSSTCKGP